MPLHLIDLHLSVKCLQINTHRSQTNKLFQFRSFFSDFSEIFSVSASFGAVINETNGIVDVISI